MTFYSVTGCDTGMQPNGAHFQACELTKSYGGRKVVKNVSVEVRAGEIVGLLGPNGAGKTTIFDMMVGLCQPDSGTILLNGECITDLPLHKRARRGIGYLPQESSVFRRLSVEENILAILEMLPLSSYERYRRAEWLLKELDLIPVRSNKAYALSGGERRRLEITRALVMQPRFLLLDEPFAGIDPIAVGEIQRILLRLKEKQIGILITDHNVRETLSITDRAYIINEGSILDAGPRDVVVNSAKARAIYLGDQFRLSGERS
jgi:lipopolysaccharide export system ATP-binding protein